jgi:SulP family sulfate permease
LLHYKIPDIGNLPAGLPHIILPNLEFNHINLVLFNAISLALLGSIDSLLTAVVVDKLTKTRHDSDRELLGQGLGNIFSGFFGGLPSAGATMRSLANVQSGGRSRLSGMTHSIILLFVLLGLGRYASQIPQTCLAAILISVGISIIDYKGLKLIHKAPREDVLVMIVVLLLTVFVDLIVAVAVGVTLACTLFAKKLSDTTLFTVGNLDSLEHLHEIYEHLPVDLRKKIYFYTFRGPIFFADVRNFTDSLENVSKAKYIIMRFAHVPIIDQTGAYALEEAINHWQEEDIKILYVGLPKHIMATIKDVGAMHNLDLDAQYETFEEAIEAIIAIEKQIE